MNTEIAECAAALDQVRRTMRESVMEAKLAIQTTVSRLLESVRSREMFLMNQIDTIHESSEDLITERLGLLLKNNVAFRDLTGDGYWSDLVPGYNVTFEADLAAMRDAVHQFGHVTSSPSLQTRRDSCTIQASVMSESECERDYIMVDRDFTHAAADDKYSSASTVDDHSFTLRCSTMMDAVGTVFPEDGLYVNIDQSTGQRFVTFDKQLDNINKSNDDRWLSAAADEVNSASSLSGCVLARYIQRIAANPTEMWLCGTRKIESPTARSVDCDFLHSFDALFCKPLEYWLSIGTAPEHRIPSAGVECHETSPTVESVMHVPAGCWLAVSKSDVRGEVSVLEQVSSPSQMSSTSDTPHSVETFTWLPACESAHCSRTNEAAVTAEITGDKSVCFHFDISGGGIDYSMDFATSFAQFCSLLAGKTTDFWLTKSQTMPGSKHCMEYDDTFAVKQSDNDVDSWLSRSSLLPEVAVKTQWLVV